MAIAFAPLAFQVSAFNVTAFMSPAFTQAAASSTDTAVVSGLSGKYPVHVGAIFDRLYPYNSVVPTAAHPRAPVAHRMAHPWPRLWSTDDDAASFRPHVENEFLSPAR